jgi:hypothetical protein
VLGVAQLHAKYYQLASKINLADAISQIHPVVNLFTAVAPERITEERNR